jgi:hypothetical protein
MSLAGATKPSFYLQLYADAEKSASLDLLRFPIVSRDSNPQRIIHKNFLDAIQK